MAPCPPAADNKESSADSKESSADADSEAPMGKAKAPAARAKVRVSRHRLVNVLVSCLVMTSFSIQTQFDTTPFAHIASMLAGSIKFELAGE